jgi:hypothetical protein
LLIKAFLVINIVQLFDTIFDSIAIQSDKSIVYTIFKRFTIDKSKVYTAYMVVWHWYLAGMFSMEVKDRYPLTGGGGGGRNPTAVVIVPYVDLSSLWFKRFVDYMKDHLFSNWPKYDIGIMRIILFMLGAIIVFVLPFVGRVFALIYILRERSCPDETDYATPGCNGGH